MPRASSGPSSSRDMVIAGDSSVARMVVAVVKIGLVNAEKPRRITLTTSDGLSSAARTRVYLEPR